MREEKCVADSITTQVQIIMEKDINGANRLFGGQLLEWIDVVAAVVARRHCHRDNLQFRAPAELGSTLFLEGRLTHVGRTSMEVRVDSFTEDLMGVRTLINRAYLVLVALDDLGHPIRVPALRLETEEERLEWKGGERRRSLRGQRRKENF